MKYLILLSLLLPGCFAEHGPCGPPAEAIAEALVSWYEPPYEADEWYWSLYVDGYGSYEYGPFPSRQAAIEHQITCQGVAPW